MTKHLADTLKVWCKKKTTATGTHETGRTYQRNTDESE
jgi:hypothetical protein